ncbi:hypothetical protein [Microseira wollei]|uniref:Uncharacterized protein n=1 Tax=Microseira wollei NIES-4236 TaxID=2530354 RepID=A0AAV3X8Z9_9CYAN|nr:hypothetical protein [Microseira wollei]GET38643.1 hypothetical protein MiSe_34020 [Microseira wollei NIES-4236]
MPPSWAVGLIAISWGSGWAIAFNQLEKYNASAKQLASPGKSGFTVTYAPISQSQKYAAGETVNLRPILGLTQIGSIRGFFSRFSFLARSW